MKNTLTKEEALKFHRQMWSDMQKELGDNPEPYERTIFKSDWCAKWIKENDWYSDHITVSCFLCQYQALRNDCSDDCDTCLIDWSSLACWVDDQDIGSCTAHYTAHYNGDYSNYSIYSCAPISEILALPERK
jgi:hypothetical protein